MRYKRKPLREIIVDPRAAAFLPLMTDAGQTPRLAPGELLRMVRTTLRMTQEQLARRSGIVQAHIARMESGRVDAQWKSWERLFAAMGCRLALRVQADGGLAGIIQGRIQQTARRKVAQGEKMFPGEPLSEAERQAEEQEWIETVSQRHTSEIWDEEDDR